MGVMYMLSELTSVLIYIGVTSSLQKSYTSNQRNCPEKHTELIYYSYMVPWGVDDRALKTAPPQISIRTSRIPDAGLGAFAETFMKKGTWLGEYEGLNIPLEDIEEYDDWTYSFMVYRGKDLHHFVDGIHVETSNWLRYINGARNPKERNVRQHLCYGRVFFILTRDVVPGAEMLIYYGEGYSELYLGIDTSVFN